MLLAGCVLALARVALSATNDISPNAPNGTLHANSDSAGVTIKLAGDEATLYAVSLNAGVWKSVNGGAWQQLPESPRYAFTIAIDPKDSSHVAVGERNGDRTFLSHNTAGAWESQDSGATWAYVVDPINDFGCASQAVPAIMFSSTSKLFAATACGLVDVAAAQFVTLPATGGGPLYNVGDRSITALSASASKIWARTADTLLVSTDDGVSWISAPIPTTCNTANGCAVDVSGFSGAANIDVKCSAVQAFEAGGGGRGDRFALAAFDEFATLSCGSIVLSQPGLGNCYVMVYDPSRSPTPWSVQRVFGETGPAGDGTGLFGRKFVRSFTLERSDLPATLGQRLQLIYDAAQNLYQATGRGSDGIITWKNFATTDAGGALPADPLLKNTIHSDTWDATIAPDGLGAWISSDGGVYQNLLAGAGWRLQDDGLHTHHVHTLNLLPTLNGQSPIAYATQDNDGWNRDATGMWRQSVGLGDADFSIADPGNTTLALFGRPSFDNTGAIVTGQGVLTAFGQPLPAGAMFSESSVFSVNHFQPFSPRSLQFIGTLEGETPTYPLLDSVMLITPPLQFRDSTDTLTPVPGMLGQAGRQVLIRNRQFAANPDIDLLYQGAYPSGQQWQCEADALPTGTRGFFVSGGHASPTYYVYASDVSGLGLYKQSGSGCGGSSWTRLNVSGLLDGSTFGPVFLSPWDPDRLFVLTSSGIKTSTDGGTTFSNDVILTSLLTELGEYPLTGSFGGGNSLGVFLASQAKPMGTLSHVFFDRHRAHAVVAASPFTGVFFSPGDGTWDDLSANLPRPFTPVSGVGIDGQAVYVGFEGRSVVRFTGADLSITKTGEPDPVAPGEQLTYQLTVSNSGPNEALGVSVVDVLPGGVGFDTASITCIEAPAGTLTCTLGDIAAGDSRTFTIKGTLAADFVRQACEPTFVANTASVRAGTVDPDPSNNDASAMTEVVFPVRHFQCYEAHRQTPASVPEVDLNDSFGSSTVHVGKLKRLCNPADKNGEDPTAPTDPCHLTGYEIDQTTPFARVPNQIVRNQFGVTVVEVRRPELLLLPTAKDLAGPPAHLVNPPIDHFECHRVHRATTRVAGLSVADQFGSLVDHVLKPFRLCAAADKNGEGVVDSHTHLLCYKVRTDPPRPTIHGPFFITNQFDDLELRVTRTREFCVPSTLDAE